MRKYISIFRLVLRCLLVARKENSTGFSTGLTGRSKNLDPTGRSTQPVSISGPRAPWLLANGPWLLVRAPWLLVRGPGIPLLSLIL